MEHIANGEATINYRQLLVPYSHSFHDELALEIALRLLANDSRRQAIVLNVNSEQQDDLTEILTNLPRQISDRIGVKNLSPEVAVERAIEASQRADLTLMGTSRTWGLQRTLGRYADALAVECHSPALIVRRYSKLNTHIANIQTPIEGVFVSEAESATKSSTEASWDTGKTS
jgi:nucleotide-binding universal stress UspA family protein